MYHNEKLINNECGPCDCSHSTIFSPNKTFSQAREYLMAFYFYLGMPGNNVEIIMGMLRQESEIELRDFCPGEFSFIEYPTNYMCYYLL